MSVSIRRAEPADTDAVIALLRLLGYEVSAAHVSRALSQPNENEQTLVAVNNGAVVGMIALFISRWIQLEKPVARVPAMIVADKFQRRGIGRSLIEHAATYARNAGCGTLELTSGNERDDAHSFYRDIGFEQNSLRFKRML